MSGSNKTILYVEDDTDFHTYVDALLEGTVKVAPVHTTRDARALLTGFTFDLFLLDLVLKDGSGSSLARELKQNYPDTPIVILSAHNVSDTVEEAEASFIKSRLNEDEFVNTIAELLSMEAAD